MNSIKYFFIALWYRSLFNFRLNKILNLYQDKVIESFDLSKTKDSYWINCNNGYLKPAEILQDKEELYGSFLEQVERICRSWQYFSDPFQKDLFWLVKYVVLLRKMYSSKQYEYSNIHENAVSDHIYEM